MKYHYVAIRIAKQINRNKTGNTSCRKTEIFIHCLISMENDTATLKDLMAALTKLNIVFTCDPAIVL